MIYGYCRCSTDETLQDISRQQRELIDLGVKPENIYIEYAHATNMNRVEFNRLLSSINSGDTIVATELSRITRSTKDLIEILELAKARRIKLVLGSFVCDCTKDQLDPMTEGMLKMMGVFAEMERNIISQRVKSGMKNAKAKGKVIGRPTTTKDDLPSSFIKNYNLYQKGKLNKSELARVCALSRNTINKYISIIEE